MPLSAWSAWTSDGAGVGFGGGSSLSAGLLPATGGSIESAVGSLDAGQPSSIQITAGKFCLHQTRPVDLHQGRLCLHFVSRNGRSGC
jgi:hypothetical protein